jgi:hypothetical protein
VGIFYVMKSSLESEICREATCLVRDLFVNLPNSGSRTWVYVLRGQVLEGAFRAFKRSNFDPSAPLDVKFIGEMGIDCGGPFREFCRLATVEIAASSIFWGPEASKNLELDQNGKFCFVLCSSEIALKANDLQHPKNHDDVVKVILSS